MSFSKGNVFALIFIVLIVAAATFYAWTSVQKGKQTALQNSPAGLSLRSDEQVSPYTDLEGNPVALTDYVGKVLVVNSWASWCPFCGGELTKLSSIAETYTDEGVQVLAINRAEPATTAERFLRSVGATDGVMLILDPDDRYFESIEGFTMPETVIYDRTGAVIYRHHGEVPIDKLRQYLDEAITDTE